MGHQCWANSWCSRQEYLDMLGIPNETEGSILEENVVQMFEKLGCNISPKSIETCPRVTKKISTFIVKFSRRKGCKFWL